MEPAGAAAGGVGVKEVSVCTDKTGDAEKFLTDGSIWIEHRGEVKIGRMWMNLRQKQSRLRNISLPVLSSLSICPRMF